MSKSGIGSTVCKARCNRVEHHGSAQVQYEGYSIGLGSPQYDPNPESENGRFFTATPSINIQLGVLNVEAAKLFEEGKDYYVYFVPCEPATVEQDPKSEQADAAEAEAPASGGAVVG